MAVSRLPTPHKFRGHPGRHPRDNRPHAAAREPLTFHFRLNARQLAESHPLTGRTLMKVADLDGMALDYWVARSLHDFVREIYFTDSGETVAIRGNDHGRPWDGRFTPSSTWETAAVVLERAQRFEVRESSHRGTAHCAAQFEGGNGMVEGRGESLRIALLRAFVTSQFGETVDNVLHQAQSLIGVRAHTADEQTISDSYEELPAPDGQIGDIQTQPR
jgi:hypothetical protein